MTMTDNIKTVMRKSIIPVLISLCMSVSVSAGVNDVTCKVYGEVIGRPESKEALIFKAGTDFRVTGFEKVLPIADGEFSCTLKDSVTFAYQVVFDDELINGSWRIRHFYSGNGDVRLSYHDEKHADDDCIDSDIVDNVLANRLSRVEKTEYLAVQNGLYARIDSLFECNGVYSKEYQALAERMATLQPGQELDSLRTLAGTKMKRSREDCYSTEYLNYEKQLKEIYAKVDSVKRVIISESPSVYGLSCIKEAFFNAKFGHDWNDIQSYKRIFYDVYKDYDHPYVVEIIRLADALEVKPGNKYPDYKISREDGTSERIASLIKGNVAIIDLWASWCGPCRKHSKELIPLYEKYKDKGFKVIAIARESDNCEAMNYAIQMDGYPWESFVDLNDRDNVWQINAAGNSGGKIILVDADGAIVGTDLPIKEIEDYLIKAYY